MRELLTSHEDAIDALEINMCVLEKFLREYVRELTVDEEPHRQAGLRSAATTLTDNIPRLKAAASRARAALGLPR